MVRDVNHPDNYSSGPTHTFQQLLFWPHQYFPTITLLAPPILTNNYSSGPTHTYQQLLFWSHPYLSTITLLVPPILINNYSSRPTHTYQQLLTNLHPPLYQLCSFVRNKMATTNIFGANLPGTIVIVDDKHGWD